jgi:phosphoribosylformimino-5-aminoimidazole carboxamide ribotide isomerase
VIVIPAIDIRGGRVVRLKHGRAEEETAYADDPVEVARRFVAEGAMWLHLVDLDAAMGTGHNHEILGEVVGAAGAQVQVAGGLRSPQALDDALAGGAARLVLGTAAVLDPGFLRASVDRLGDRLIAAVDVDGDQVLVRGWKERAGKLGEVLPRLEEEGAPRLLVTQVARDGTLSGPDIGLYTRLVERCGRPVLASGGVRDVDDLRALSATGVEAAIVGTALYEGHLTVAQATQAIK